jgi:hypothetical protein
MRKVLTALAVLAIASFPAWAQTIETQKPDRDRIVHVQTALNHLTVIEVGEPVTMVAAGSEAFKVEWRETKVFVQPTEPNVATNLFIWTASGRLNYELEPAGPIAKMDFAIDQPGGRPAAAKPTTVAAADTAGGTQAATSALLGGRPIRTDMFKEPKNRVVVLLKDTFRRENQLIIRYSVQNDSNQGYDLGKPQVFRLEVRKSPRLHRLANYQLGKDEAERLGSAEEKPVEVVDAQLRSTRVEPGQETVGYVGVTLPTAKTDTPQVLRLTFPADDIGPISATLVL